MNIKILPLIFTIPFLLIIIIGGSIAAIEMLKTGNKDSKIFAFFVLLTLIGIIISLLFNIF
ncbi:hypothetical protein [Fusobacterium necrophorum]|uniref:hypothetical protein n=1 Tax=Fusobacterium necrophorum TaxID=859 RepID=UPI00254DB40E|nr:hypothetical protein [Fusobacterium necrophorum]MDK4524972.1 hypothetical protein [Fusobacterium necrophorum]